jgi:hypothetical protein
MSLWRSGVRKFERKCRLPSESCSIDLGGLSFNLLP